jgi:hypothetical protein
VPELLFAFKLCFQDLLSRFAFAKGMLKGLCDALIVFVVVSGHQGLSLK